MRFVTPFCRKTVLFCSLLLAGETAIAQNAQQVPQPLILLNRMVVALSSQSYVGEFTYEHRGPLESFRILQAIDGERHVERLYRMTGSELEFIRSSDSAQCGTLGGRLLAGMTMSSVDGQVYGIEKNYQLELAGRDRIADRTAWVLNLLPRDQHRFGMRLAIDEASNLPTRYTIFDAQKGVLLERLQFVSLETGIEVDEADFSNTPQNRSIEVSPQQCIGTRYTSASKSPWKPSWLPDGFVPSNYSYSEDDGHMESYTDGLSSFSIFLKSAKDEELENYTGRIEQGSTARGAATTLVSLLPLEPRPIFVTVVGEIPLATAQKVTLSVQKVLLPETTPVPADTPADAAEQSEETEAAAESDAN